jgi:hypothetical protein
MILKLSTSFEKVRIYLEMRQRTFELLQQWKAVLKSDETKVGYSGNGQVPLGLDRSSFSDRLIEPPRGLWQYNPRVCRHKTAWHVKIEDLSESMSIFAG